MSLLAGMVVGYGRNAARDEALAAANLGAARVLLVTAPAPAT